MPIADTDMTELAISEISSNVDGHEEIFYQSAEFWVGFAFVLVVALLFSPIAKLIRAQAEKRISRIKKELQEAEDLKLDAQKLYADYERKLLNADNEVANIVAEEKEVIAETKERRMHELNIMLKRKQEEADGRIEMAFERANAEINALISKKTLNILKSVMMEKMTKKDHEQLIEKSINNLNDFTFNNERAS